MSTSTAYLKQINGISFVAKAGSNHWITMDGPEHVGGNDAGPRPKELVLMALAGCTASDVVSILKKKRVKLDNFEINISADICEGHPKVFTKIDLEYVFYGNEIGEKDVERAIELSQTTYCGVTDMLKKAAEINHTYRIEKSK